MSGGKGGGGKGGLPGRHAFKVLCPEPLVSSVMGPRGSTKDSIQEETGCRLIVSNREDYFPGTRLRVLVIYSDEPGGIVAALGRVIGHIGQCGEKERTEPNPHHQGPEAEFLGKEPGEYILRAAIPSKASGAIIGPKGVNIQAIRDEYCAKVFIDKTVSQGHQVLKLIAGLDNIRVAVARICDSVQEDARSNEFREWAMVRSFPTGPPEGGAIWGEDGLWDQQGYDMQLGLGGGGPPPGGHHGKGGGKGGGGERRRQRSRSRGREPAMASMQMGGGGADLGSLDATLAEFPEDKLDLEYAITCDLPRAKVSALIGKSGEHIKAVRRATDTQIRFDEGGGPKGETQTMMVRGRLVNVYKAHAMMMKRYHEDDVDSQRSAHVEGLQEQLAQLQRQLEQATGSGGKGNGKKGK